MVRTAQKTLYATDLHLAMLSGKPYTPLTNTTLNEKFGLNQEAQLPTGTYPTLKYFAIGAGGTSMINYDDNYMYSEHSPIDAALFTHIPFIIRPTNADLTDIEKASYRLRVTTTISGVNYACYYLKLLPEMDIPSYFNQIETITPKDETKLPYSTISVFDHNIPEILSPVPRNRQITIDNISSIKKISKLAKITLEFTQSDLTEIKNAMRIMGISSSAIKEIGLVTGHDIAAGNTKEIIAAQVMYHIGMEIALTIDMLNSPSVKRIIELGGEEPLVY